MKNLFKPFSKTAALLMLCLAACTEPTETLNPQPGTEQPTDDGMVTEVGKPVGAPVTKMIGPDGGSIEIPGQKMTFKVPAGAISKPVNVTVQPVENNAPGGTGLAYELTPKNIGLEKDIEMTWNYTDEDIEGTVAEALGSAYQDENGVWQGTKEVQIDKNAKTVTAKVNKMAHSAFYKQFYLTYTNRLVVNEQMVIEVNYSAGFNEDDLLVPLSRKVLSADKVVKWTINGSQAGGHHEVPGNVGQLLEDGASARATYTAPPHVPAKNPVFVSAYVNLRSAGQLILSAPITIENPAFMKIGDYYEGNPSVGLVLQGNVLSGIMNDPTGQNAIITFRAEEAKMGEGFYEVNKQGTVVIAPKVAEKPPYVQGYYKNVQWISGGGIISIEDYKGPDKEVTVRIKGTFFEPHLDGRIDSHKVEAKFRTRILKI